jgi:hypothetical protein
MTRHLSTPIASLVLILAVGCGAQQQPAPQASGPAGSDPAGATTGSAAAATSEEAVPRLITELTSETLVYECPVCKMTFADPGVCTMKCAELVRTQVAYVCVADGKPVDRAGDCPRCDVDAKVVLTAMTSEPPPALKGP